MCCLDGVYVIGWTGLHTNIICSYMQTMFQDLLPTYNLYVLCETTIGLQWLSTTLIEMNYRHYHKLRREEWCRNFWLQSCHSIQFSNTKLEHDHVSQIIASHHQMRPSKSDRFDSDKYYLVNKSIFSQSQWMSAMYNTMNQLPFLFVSLKFNEWIGMEASLFIGFFK